MSLLALVGLNSGDLGTAFIPFLPLVLRSRTDITTLNNTLIPIVVISQLGTPRDARDIILVKLLEIYLKQRTIFTNFIVPYTLRHSGF